MKATVIITTNENKKKILRENSMKHTYANLKFYTFLELKKNLLFDYDVKTIEFVATHYQVSVSVAKIYLENLYFLKDLDDEKVKFLNGLKKDLDEHGLLIYHESFKEYLLDKRIIVYDYPVLNKEQKLILSLLDREVEYQKSEDIEYKPVIYEAKDIDAEVEFVMEKIGDLLDQNIPLSKIKIIASADYYNILTRYFYLYHLPFYKGNTHSFYSTMVAQEFIHQYELYSIEENVLHLSEKYQNVGDLVRIINQSVMIEDKTLRKEFIIEDLKTSKIKEDMYEEQIEICSLTDNFDSSHHVFLLGFNVNSYPKIKRDISYLSDEVRMRLGLDTSTDINHNQKLTILKRITDIKNLTITYKLHSNEGACYPSMLIKEVGLEVLPVKLDASVSHSRIFSKIKYATLLDNLYKFNSVYPDLAIYQNNLTIPYFQYNNQFTGIPNSILKDKLNHNLTLSYTNLEMYQECAFKYYVSKVLRLDIFEETFKTILGSIMHHILEVGIVKEIDIPVEMIKFVKDKGYQLNAKELFYLDLFSRELTKILNVIKRQQKHSSLKHYLFEQEFFVYKDSKEMNITFKGNIDKVMYEEINGREVIAVVDYKTGNTMITLKNLDYGLNIQLPIYLYLLKRSDRFKDALIAGFYIQKVLAKKENIQFKKTEEELLESRLRLQGYTNRDEYLMEMIDDEYQNSTVLQNLKFKKDGELSSTSKVLSNEEMNELISRVDAIIDEVILNILDGKFLINPKVIKGNNVACTYCHFKDICYKRKQNEVILGGDEDGLDTGTVTCN